MLVTPRAVTSGTCLPERYVPRATGQPWEGHCLCFWNACVNERKHASMQKEIYVLLKKWKSPFGTCKLKTAHKLEFFENMVREFR